MQSIIGTNLTISGGGGALPDPGGWFSYVDNAINGWLKWKIYDNYHNESINLSSYNMIEEGTAVPNLQAGPNYRTYMFTGYMMLPADGNYTFRTTSDDGSYFWVGVNAWDGNYTIENALINNGGLHGSVSVDSQTISMTGNVWYPIRILFGNFEGGTYLTFQYSLNNGGFTTADYASNALTAEGFN